ncbi:hypothetical protein ACFLY1_00180 [Patescibacteria group bacterium]
MKKSKKQILLGGIIALVAVAALASSTLSVSAHQSGGSKAAIMETVEAGDYNAFREAAKGKRIGEVVENEGEFNRLVEAHNLKEQAREIMEEIGFEHRGNHGRHGHK